MVFESNVEYNPETGTYTPTDTTRSSDVIQNYGGGSSSSSSKKPDTSGGGSSSGSTSQNNTATRYYYNPKTGTKTYRTNGSTPGDDYVAISKSEYQGLKYDKQKDELVAKNKEIAENINVRTGAESNVVRLPSGKYVRRGSKDDTGLRYGDSGRTARDVILTTRKRYGKDAPIEAVGYTAQQL